MLRKIGKKITNNLGLKILAALFAIALWIVVVNIDDPIKTKTYTISVMPINEDYVTDQGKYYEWLDGNNTISFKVSAMRSIMAKLSNADFSATADLEKIEVDEEGNYRVPVAISTSKYGSEEVSISPKQLYLDVALEDLGSCQKAITATTKGNVADGCAIGELKIVGSNVLKISGPSSVVSQIDTVAAIINVEGMSTDVTDNVVPVLYDAEGNVINTAKLKLNLNTVAISAQILNTKDVALEFDTIGKAAEGYMVTGIKCSLDTVRIKGDGAVLNPVNKITIPAEVLDVTDLTEDLETIVDISSYLPSGTSLVLKTDAKVEVRVKIEPLVTNTYEIPVNKIAAANLRDGCRMQYGANAIYVEVGGAKSVVSAITADVIGASVDMSGLGEGEHQVGVSFTLTDENCWVNGTVSVPVTIINTMAASEETDEETAEQTPAADSGNPENGDDSGKPESNSGAGEKDPATEKEPVTDDSAGEKEPVTDDLEGESSADDSAGEKDSETEKEPVADDSTETSAIVTDETEEPEE